MPIIRRVGFTGGFTRFKNGQVIEDVEMLVAVSGAIVKELESAKSEGASEAKKVFQDLNTASKTLQDNLNQIGAMIYPGVSDRYKVQFRGERIANMPDYGKDIYPKFKAVQKYCKKEAKIVETLSKRVEKVGDISKTISEKIENIDLAMRIIANKLS